ncbi:uncharacterized protein LOC120347583 [Styela clava]
MNCLNQAISEERIHQVRLLLSMGVDNEMKDKNDFERTPLIKSCLVNNQEASLRLLKILLKFGVTINAVDILGKSALHYACETGKAEVAKVLMNEDGIELNTQDNKGQTPLMLACAEGHLVMARILMGKLVKFDLEIDLRDSQGYTALLLAIKNEHYDVSHDLVRYANACITLRDNEKFMNAAEWLKSNLEERRKTKQTTHEGDKARKKRHEMKSPTKSDKDKENIEQQADDVPVLVLTESQEQPLADEYENGSEGQGDPGTATSLASMSGLLFEPDPYGSFIRPPSSGGQSVSKRASTAGSFRRSPSAGGRMSRPQTGASVASSSKSQRFSASSRRKMTKMEHLEEESTLTTSSATPVLNPTVKTLKREAGAESAISFTTSRNSRRSFKMDDLESIIEDPNSRQPSRDGGRESALRTQSQQETADRSPGSFRSRSPYNQAGRKSRSDYNEEKSSEIYAIQKLKQALRDKTRRKITRASTAVFRPASGTPSEQWMSNIIKGGKRGPVPTKSAYVAPKSPDPTKSPTQTRKQSIRSMTADTSSVVSGDVSRKLSMTQFRDTSPAMRLLHAASNLSLDTLISQSDVTLSTSYYPEYVKSRKSKNSSQLQTIFRLYTDSCLWKPPTRKPASLSVQINSDNSEKLTLQSEMSDSINEFGSTGGDRNETATTSSVPQRVRPESKTGARNRLISSSATSRVSRGSRNAGSAGGRSVASRQAD